MNTNPIFLLNFIKRAKAKYDGHFIFKIQEKLQVLTSNPIKGVKCVKITDTNVKGEEKEQFLVVGVTHKFDFQMHKLTQTHECHTYYAQNKPIVDYYCHKMCNPNTEE